MADTEQRAPAALRRRLLVAGAAVGGVVAGGLLAWRQQRPQDEAAGAVEALWQREFPTPDGGTLQMAALRGKPLLLNFWATWCPPCVEEMPLLDRFFRDNAGAGWQVLGLAVDQGAAVRQFLARTPVTFPIGLAGLEGTELGRTLGNQVGGLPFSVLIGADGQVRVRKMGQLTAAELSKWRAQAGT